MGPLQIEWEMGYNQSVMESALHLSGVEPIELLPSHIGILMTDQDIFLNTMEIDVQHQYEEMTTLYTLNNTNSNGEYSPFSSYLEMDGTSVIAVKLSDKDGFESATLEKTYKKVRPAKAIKRPRNIKKGLAYSSYEGIFDSVPDFSSLIPLKKGSSQRLNPDEFGQRLDHFAIQYKGLISIPKTRIYTFHLKSDDGSKLYINNQLIIDNDVSHDSTTKTGMVALEKGFHPVLIDYFENFLEEILELDYSVPHIKKSPAIFWH